MSDSTRMFGGPAYNQALDRARLSAQIERIRALALRMEWFTLREIKAELEMTYSPSAFPESSVSAQLRNLKKAPYSHVLEKRRRIGAHGPGAGIWEYRLLPPRPQLDLFGRARATAVRNSVESQA